MALESYVGLTDLEAHLWIFVDDTLEGKES